MDDTNSDTGLFLLFTFVFCFYKCRFTTYALCFALMAHQIYVAYVMVTVNGSTILFAAVWSLFWLFVPIWSVCFCFLPDYRIWVC